MKKLLYWIPFVVYSVVLVHLLLTPAENIPSFFMNKGDKILHLTAFAGLKYFYFAAHTEFFRHLNKGFEFVLYGIVGLAAAGGVLEILQAMVPGRSSSITDIYFNVAGLIIGLLVALANFYCVKFLRKVFY